MHVRNPAVFPTPGDPVAAMNEEAAAKHRILEDAARRSFKSLGQHAILEVLLALEKCQRVQAFALDHIARGLLPDAAAKVFHNAEESFELLKKWAVQHGIFPAGHTIRVASDAGDARDITFT